MYGKKIMFSYLFWRKKLYIYRYRFMYGKNVYFKWTNSVSYLLSSYYQWKSYTIKYYDKVSTDISFPGPGVCLAPRAPRADPPLCSCCPSPPGADGKNMTISLILTRSSPVWVFSPGLGGSWHGTKFCSDLSHISHMGDCAYMKIWSITYSVHHTIIHSRCRSAPF